MTRALETIVRKEENTGNKRFLPIPPYFVRFQSQISLFQPHQIYHVSENALDIIAW